jgi:hypothetical protein
MGIKLIAVPRSMTGRYQPLDRSCFGPLKKISEALWDRRCAEEPNLSWSHAQGAPLLEEAWPMLSAHAVVAGWDFIGDALVEPSPEDSGSDASDDRDFRVSEGENAGWCAHGSAWERRVALTRVRGTWGLAPPEEVRPDLHELSCEIDDEEGFLAKDEARLGARRRTRGRGTTRAPRRGALGTARGRANSRGRGTTRARGVGGGEDWMGVGAGVTGQEATSQSGVGWESVWRPVADVLPDG